MPTLRFKLPNFHTTATQMPVSTATPRETSSSESSETSAESCSPFLHPELIYLILLRLWEAPQALQERWALLKNVALVNRAWLALITRISCQDVHISSRRQANTFLRLLPGCCPTQRGDDLFTTEGSRIANEVRRSITFYVASNLKAAWSVSPLSKRTPTTADDAASAICLVLDTLSSRSHLPNLRHVSLQYKNWDYGDAFAHLERGTFPPQVTSLSVHYSFSDWVDLFAMAMDWFKARARARQARTGGVGTVRVPTLRHLSLSEVTTDPGLHILEVCPNVETLEIMKPSEGPIRVFGITPLPPTVRTLVLRHQGVALSDKEMLCRWRLHVALEDGLFPEGAIRPRIVVCSGQPEPVHFTAVRRICEHFNAELVYERDDAQSPSSWHD